MSQSVSPQEVWETLKKDRYIRDFPKSVQEVIKTLAESMPEALRDHVDKPLTMDSLQLAQIAIFSLALSTGFVPNMVNAQYKRKTASFRKKKAIDDAVDLRKFVRLIMKNMPQNTLQLKLHGMTERDFLKLKTPAGLSGKTLALYDKGSLTVGDLLRLQPIVLLKCI